MRRGLTLLFATWLGWAAVAAAPPARSPEQTPAVDLPVTIEKVWYRSGGKRREGDLMVGEEGLEVTARKKSFSLPLERIQFISRGPWKREVDTEWILLTVGVAPPYDLVGIRDGKKWGFGGRTDAIYRQLRKLLKQLGAAQFRVAPGFRVYEDPDCALALAYPEDWSTYLVSLVLAGGSAPGGTTIISERKIRSIEPTADGRGRAEDDLELLDAILAGESPAFFVVHDEPGRGMDCAGFSGGARERLLARASDDVVFGEDYEVIEPPAASPDVVGGCDALRITGRSRRRDGAEVRFELYAVAPGETLFLFGLRALSDRYEAFREPFVDAVATVDFGVLAPR